MLALSFMLLAQQMLGADPTGREFSEATTHHAMASAHAWQDSVLVGLAVVVMIATTLYAVRLLIRPGEADGDHIKRRIIDDAAEGYR